MKAYNIKIYKEHDARRNINIERVEKAKGYLALGSQLKKFSGFDASVNDYTTASLERCRDYIRHTRHALKKQNEFVKVTHVKSGAVVDAAIVDGKIHESVIYAYRKIKEEIREKRQALKQVRVTTVTKYIQGERWTINKSGGILVEGELMRISRSRRARLVFIAKSPKTDDNHIGLEIEFTARAERDALGTALLEAGLSKYVHLKGDGSIRVTRDRHSAFELTLCVPQHLRDEIIDRTIAVLRQFEASVNKSCGLHVHLDMRNRDRAKSFSNLVSAQNVLYAMQPKSRQENTYCVKTKSKDVDKERRGSRYKGVNATAIDKFRTIEIRIHSGTVDAYKIKEWVTLLIGIVDSTPSFKRAPRTLDSFCKGYGLTEQTKRYIVDRIRKFNGSEVLNGEDSDVA